MLILFKHRISKIMYILSRFSRSCKHRSSLLPSKLHVDAVKNAIKSATLGTVAGVKCNKWLFV